MGDPNTILDAVCNNHRFISLLRALTRHLRQPPSFRAVIFITLSRVAFGWNRTIFRTKSESKRWSPLPHNSEAAQERFNNEVLESELLGVLRDKYGGNLSTLVEEKNKSWEKKGISSGSKLKENRTSCLIPVDMVIAAYLPVSICLIELSLSFSNRATELMTMIVLASVPSVIAFDFPCCFFRKTIHHCIDATDPFCLASCFQERLLVFIKFPVTICHLLDSKRLMRLSMLVKSSGEHNTEASRLLSEKLATLLKGFKVGCEFIVFEEFGKMYYCGTYIYDVQMGNFAAASSKIVGSQSTKRMSLSPWRSRTPSQKLIPTDLQGIDELNLDEPAVAIPAAQESVKEPDEKAEDLDIPDFDVVDKGVEIQEKDRAEDELSEENSNSDKRSVSSEVVKEIVQDQFHLTRMTELDSIAQQIKALESMLGDESSVKTEEETQSQGLDADEETVTREFLQMLEDSDTNQFKVNRQALQLEEDENSGKKESEVFLPDLGKGLGCVVQTRNGGYLASLNPLNVALARTDSPKLAMQMSKPLVLPSHTSVNGIELFQRMAAAGVEEMSSQILALMPMDELIGKTAEQIAFEGIASSIIQGRNKEGASSSAARTVAVVKSMANAMNSGRKGRISTGIWNVSEDPLTAEEILAFSMQKIEEMTVEALKIQAGIAEEQAPFDVSAINVKEKSHPLAHAVPLEDWVRDNSVATSNDDNGSTENIAIFVVVQLRDPLRQYEAVGGPMIALIQAAHVDMGPDNYDEEKRFKVATLHVGGLRVKSGGKKNVWDTEKQRLTAMQWLIAYGLGKMGKKGKHQATKGQELIWSISSRIMADMWLKPIRNPDVKFTK
nr:protein PLASTID MOVEMENT IMPAIRED 1 [Ipomoea batatas]